MRYILATVSALAIAFSPALAAAQPYSTPITGSVQLDLPASAVAPVLPSAFDSAYCSTVGYLLVRFTGTWTCAKGIAANPVWWGADPTGAADSTPAIAAALAASTSVQLPAGTFKVSSLDIEQSGTRLLGSGRGATILSPTTTTGDVIDIGTASTNPSDVTVGNFSLISPTTRTSGADIRVTNGHLITVEDVVITGNSFDGIVFDGGPQQYEYFLRNFEIGYTSDMAVEIGPSALTQDVFISHGEINAAGNGIGLFWSSGVYADNVGITASHANGVVTYPASGHVVEFSRFNNVLADTTSGTGWNIGSGGGAVYNTEMIDCWGSSSTLRGVNINGVNVSGVSIIGGDYINNQQDGIVATSGIGLLIEGATVGYNSQAGTDQYQGINIGPGVSHFSIIGNQSGGYGDPVGGTNKQGWGILVNTGASNYYIVSLNRVDGNSAGGVIDAGTGTTKVVGSNL